MSQHDLTITRAMRVAVRKLRHFYKILTGKYRPIADSLRHTGVVKTVEGFECGYE
mgnify:CR=1 FL=1